MQAFEVKNELPEWLKAYNTFSGDIGSVVTYKDLDRALGRSFRSSRGPIYRANKELQRKRHRTLEVVPNVGYRIIAPSEHERSGRKQHKKSKRALKRSAAIFSSADRSLLSADEARRIDTLEMVVGQQSAAIARLDARADEHEKAIKSLVQKTENAQSPVVTSRLGEIEKALIAAGLMKSGPSVAQ